MQHRDIVVIGGSAGSIDPLKVILGSLPARFSASIFVVIHIAVEYPSTLHEQLSRLGPLPATQPHDGELIRRGHVYIAPPDYHLMLEGNRIRVEHGPRENRHRPAIDPLFRTAARRYGPRVIGIILSGHQDDGSAGLYAVKQRGGIAIVQNPRDAAATAMPTNALDYAGPQYILRTHEIASTLVKLVHNGETEAAMPKRKSNHKPSGTKAGKKSRKQDLAVSAETPSGNLEVAYSDEGQGTPSVFACPECHGVLWELRDDKLVRFRCRVGHSFTMDSLAQELSQGSEAALWAAMRALEEKGAMQRRLADSLRSNPTSAQRLRDQSAADDANARLIREMIFRRDAQLQSKDSERKTAEVKVA